MSSHNAYQVRSSCANFSCSFAGRLLGLCAPLDFPTRITLLSQLQFLPVFFYRCYSVLLLHVAVCRFRNLIGRSMFFSLFSTCVVVAPHFVYVPTGEQTKKREGRSLTDHAYWNFWSYLFWIEHRCRFAFWVSA